LEAFKNIDGKYEAALAARIRAGDSAAEEEMLVRYSRAVMIIINRASNSCSSAQDICQETFSIAIQKIRRGELREPEKLPAFIWSLAHNLVIEHFRKQASENFSSVELTDHLADPAMSQLDQLLKKEKALIARQVIDELRSDRDREVLRRFYIAEEDKEQICADLGLNSLQFNLVLFRARKHYKKLYEKIAARAYK
jgi:RNA polymerase sigma-70 factor (ECF subfamily)